MKDAAHRHWLRVGEAGRDLCFFVCLLLGLLLLPSPAQAWLRSPRCQHPSSPTHPPQGSLPPPLPGSGPQLGKVGAVPRGPCWGQGSRRLGSSQAQHLCLWQSPSPPGALCPELYSGQSCCHLSAAHTATGDSPGGFHQVPREPLLPYRHSLYIVMAMALGRSTYSGGRESMTQS